MTNRFDPAPARATTLPRDARAGVWSDWLLTIRQAAWSLPRLWPHLVPTFHLPSVAAIDPEFIHRHGIDGFIWDVDGTLMGCRHNAVAADLQPTISEIFNFRSLRHVILSNCSEHRFLQLSVMFPSVPVLRGYATPSGILFRRVVGSTDSWANDPPPANLQHVRKPSVELVHFALRELDLPPNRVVVVGDQYLTDVAGANLVGIRSIKVPTWAPESFSPWVRLLQRVDTTCFRLSNLPRRRASPSGSVR